ncbi:hypothetical protein M427DRAFT_59739 [Gonapodya prolifera JEL478]|uniref:Cytochrome c oxidase assembly protein COX16, mitochondrial n=1 Tax=Gonapodya prolifera (strain JEL478) TaxID=1344416 RepID=A0A139A6F5_GONPJ|nr:hypothetical protein M427DRAFT_59739 [Gonapodya prolifera JEL478]|eukprot:KXS12229.1 hypothetical protein M427DRAFT_59739 [Gonapodya prolifera JEL478]
MSFPSRPGSRRFRLPSGSLLRVGAPMMLAVVGGSFALSMFTDVGIQQKDKRRKFYRSESELGLDHERKRSSLQEELEKTVGKIDLEHWEMKRVERRQDAYEQV